VYSKSLFNQYHLSVKTRSRYSVSLPSTDTVSKGICYKRKGADSILLEVLCTTTNKNEAEEHIFSSLVDNFSESVYKFCRSLTYCKEDAEDLFQETFLKVMETNKISISENPKNFLLSTANYIWKSQKRKYARRNRIIPIAPLDGEEENMLSDISVESSIMTKEDADTVRKIVHSLPEKFKLPVILHYTMDMSLADAAEMLKIPIGTVKSRLHKARKLIEEKLKEVGYEK